MKCDERCEELLELVWILREQNANTTEELLRRSQDPEAESQLTTLQTQGLVDVRDGLVQLTPAGEAIAAGVVRRHRLAEVLLTELLELSPDEAESNACRFEHILSESATDSVCTLLGHPPRCPHGRPIPRGRCCEAFLTEVKPLVMPLSHLCPGASARIVFISPRNGPSLDRLSAFGVIPGAVLKLHQKHPSLVIQIGHTEVAIDPEIAAGIFVRQLEPTLQPEAPGRAAGMRRRRLGPPWRFR
ncbi:MAG: metal-dependent transcriptional regulator [Armatimonadota bacterium]